MNYSIMSRKKINCIKGECVRLGRILESYRWICGIVIWVSLSFLQIHGSSIGAYATLLGTPEFNTAILGINRGCRLDEFMVSTPIAFSQYFDLGNGNFNTYSEILRAAPTNVGLLFGQPCWNLISLFRPFLWGYLFLPQGAGLSFFWVGRLVVLLLASYDFALVFTDRKKILSFSYSLMIGFSPIVQWWFATNSFVEMLIFGQLEISLLFLYLNTERKIHGNFYILGMFYCGIAYIFAIYPAWQIPFAYIFLGIAGWVIYKNRMYKKY